MVRVTLREGGGWGVQLKKLHWMTSWKSYLEYMPKCFRFSPVSLTYIKKQASAEDFHMVLWHQAAYMFGLVQPTVSSWCFFYWFFVDSPSSPPSCRRVWASGLLRSSPETRCWCQLQDSWRMDSNALSCSLWTDILCWSSNQVNVECHFSTNRKRMNIVIRS